MKTNTLLAALVSALACGNAHADSSQNLIQNGDFSNAAQISGWKESGSGSLSFSPQDIENTSASGSILVQTGSNGSRESATSTCFAVNPGTAFSYAVHLASPRDPRTNGEMSCAGYSDSACQQPTRTLGSPASLTGSLFAWILTEPVSGIIDNEHSAQCTLSAFLEPPTMQPGSVVFDNAYFNSTSAELLGGYMSGNWYDPTNPGEGFQLEFTAQNNTLLAVWFTYEPSGGSNLPIWIFMQSTYDTTQNSVTTPAYYLHGAAFPPQFHSADVVNDPWGTVTFTFFDCNHGTVSWNPTLVGYSPGSMAISRLTSIAGTSCPQ